MLARVTVYWRAEGGPHASWNGLRLREGHCAVDPRKIPYGSKVVIDGEALTAVDTGPAVINRKAARLAGHTPAQRKALVVDRYFEKKEQALAWAKSHPHFMIIRVLLPTESNQVAQASPSRASLPRETGKQPPIAPQSQIQNAWPEFAIAVAIRAQPLPRFARRRV